MSLLEEKIGIHCGPALAGIKSSNLICVRHSDCENVYNELEYLKKELNQRGITLYVLFDDGNRILLLVFRKNALLKRIKEKSSVDLLSKYDYPLEDLNSSLKYLANRIAICEEFPHEIGVFLGYPIEDVKGFMQNKSNCKKCGLWKVYGDVEVANNLFQKYKKCSIAIAKRMQRGDDLKKIFTKATLD